MEPELFGCKKCKKIFSSQNFLNIHKKENHSLKRPKCILCDESFDFKSSLQEHFQTAHDEEKLGCEKCGKDFYSKNNYIAHVNRADCKMKSLSDNSPNGLAKIDNTKMKAEKKVEVKLVSVVTYKCNVCEKRLPTKIDLFQHRYHEHKKVGTVLYFCKICPLTKFKKIDFLKTHFENTHKNHPFTKHQWSYVFECDICVKTFENHQQVMKHFIQHNDPAPAAIEIFQCDICEKSFLKIYKLKEHYKASHFKLTAVKMVEKRKVHHCDFCDKSFVDLKILKTHIQSDHQPKITPNSKNENVEKSIKQTSNANRFTKNRYQCLICNANLNNFESMITHKKSCNLESMKISLEAPEEVPESEKSQEKAKTISKSENEIMEVQNDDGDEFLESIKINPREVPEGEKSQENEIMEIEKRTEDKILDLHVFHQCKFCDETFSSLNAMEDHSRTCIKHLKEEDPFQDVVDKVENKTTDDANALVIDSENVEDMNDEFHDDEEYQIHQEMETTRIFLYKCGICDKGFDFISELTGHVASNHARRLELHRQKLQQEREMYQHF